MFVLNHSQIQKYYPTLHVKKQQLLKTKVNSVALGLKAFLRINSNKIDF